MALIAPKPEGTEASRRHAYHSYHRYYTIVNKEYIMIIVQKNAGDKRVSFGLQSL